MNAGDSLFLSNDRFTRRTPTEWTLGAINPVYEITVAPRCIFQSQPFVHHNAEVQLYARKGRFVVEIDESSFKLGEDDFLYIRYGQAYRFRSLETSPALLQIQATSSAVEEDWSLIAEPSKKSVLSR